MNKPNAIVVGTDLTPQTADLLSEAVRLARAYDGHVVLVHAVEPIENPDQADSDTAAFHDELMRKAEQWLDRRGGPVHLRRARLARPGADRNREAARGAHPGDRQPLPRRGSARRNRAPGRCPKSLSGAYPPLKPGRAGKQRASIASLSSSRRNLPNEGARLQAAGVKQISLTSFLWSTAEL